MTDVNTPKWIEIQLSSLIF